MALTTTPPPEHSVLPVALGAGGVVATATAGIAISAAGKGPTPLDTAWHDLMLGWRTDPAIAVATAMQFIGGVGSMVIAGIILVAALLVMRRPWSALTLAAAMILSEVATGTLKVLVARPRPSDSLSDTGLTSFPSGHTALAATTTVVLALLIGRCFWIVAVAWTAMMAWSRTCLEAHWLTDVLAGAVLGASVGLLAWWGVRLLRWRVRERRARRTQSATIEPGRDGGFSRSPSTSG